jgi:hypothetical protein
LFLPAEEEYRQILIKMSREFEYKGKIIERVVDITQAVTYLKESLDSK